MSGYARNGIHLFRTAMPPDAWLTALNPQSVVLVGSYEHDDAVLKTQLAAAHLVNLLPKAVVKVRYWMDDNILRRISPAGFARLFFPLHVPGTHLGVGNEDEQNSDDVRVFAETVRLWCEVVTLANAAGIPLCIGSTPMGTPQYGQYELMIPLWKLFAEGRKLGIYHIYTPNAYFPVPADEGEVIHLAKRHETEMYRVCAVAGIEPPPMMYGEYNTVESVEKSDMGPASTGLPVQLWVAGIKNAGVTCATNVFVHGDGLYDTRWTGFNVARCPGYMEAMVSSLPRSPYTLLEEWESKRVPTTFDLADYIIPNGKPYGLGGVHGSSGYEVVQSRRLANGYAETAKNNTFERIWFDDTNIYRGIDTSAIDKDEVYAQFTDGRYGAVWCKRYMKKGDIATRSPDVQHYHADGRPKNADKDIVSQLKLAAYSVSITFPETGVTVNDVLELHWLMGGAVIERYWYAKGIGLVGFGAEGITGGYHSRIAQPNETRTPPPSKAPSWFSEPLPPPVEKVTPPVPTYPAPESLGELIDGVVKSTASNYVNIRSLPSASATKMGELRAGDTVRYREPVIEAGAYSTASGTQNTWQSVSNGWVASAVLTMVPAAPVEHPIVDLRLPFVSQLGVDADLRNNDCGLAAAHALTLWQLQQAGFGDMPLLHKVDNLIPASPLATADTPVSVGKLRDYLTLLGVRHAYSNALTPDAIIQELDKGQPVLVLGNYKYVHAGSKRLGHYFTVKGYTENHFIINDSYLEGEGHRMTRAELQSALTDLKNEDGSSFASIPFQGIKLDYAA